MKSYTVFLPPHAGKLPGDTSAIDAVEDMVLVKEGFMWLAALMPALWLLAHRLWLFLLAYLVFSFGLVLLLGLVGANETVQTIVGLAIHLVFGFEAHNLKARALKGRGWREAGVAVGRNRDEAERDFLRIYEPAVPDNDFSYLHHQVSA